MIEPPIDAVGVRVLGALIEKEATTPDNYPLTLNSLTAACNQTSNREPVMQLEEAAVLDVVKQLEQRSLVRSVHRSDSRVRRYRHALADTLHLHPPELAALCVLMLRGPQTLGEIRTRTARLFEFLDLKHVEITLDGLATLPTPLAAQLPRHPGQKEVRYAHLLSGEPVPEVQASPGKEAAEPGRVEALEQEVAQLRAELAELKGRFEAFQEQFR